MKTQIKTQLNSLWKNLVFAGATLILVGNAASADGGSGILGNILKNLPIPASNTPTTNNSVRTQKVHIKVEYVEVTSLVQQEFIDWDEVFAIHVARPISDMATGSQASTAKAGLVAPVWVSKGQTKPFQYGKTIYEGDVPGAGGVAAAIQVMEEDQTHTWGESNIAKNAAQMTKEMFISTSYNPPPQTNEYLVGAALFTWRKISDPAPIGWEDIDDAVAKQSISIPATGKAGETLEFNAKGDGGSYIIRYRVTRTPIADPTPTPTVAPPATTPPVVIAPTPTPVPVTPPAPTLPNVPVKVDPIEIPKVPPILNFPNIPTLPAPPSLPDVPIKIDPIEIPKNSTVPSFPTVPPVLTVPPVVIPPVQTTPPSNGNTGIVPPVTQVPGVPLPSLPNVPAPSVPAPQVPAPNVGGTTGAFGDFRPITTWDIKLESVKIDRTGNQVEALFTFRNSTLTKQFLSGSGFEIAVIDADGVGRANDGEMYRATADEHFPTTPVLAPGASLKARYFFPLNTGTTAIRKLSLQYWRKDRLDFDISGLTWPKASTAAIPTGLKNGQDFQALGEKWDVKIDGWLKARDGGLDVFATFRNVTQENGWLTSQTMDVAAQDNEGQVKDAAGVLYRVGGTIAVPTHSLIIVPPDSEAKVRYHIAPLKGFTPSKLTFTEGRYKKDQLELPITP